MSHTQEHELGREIPRFEPWLGWALSAMMPAAAMVFTPPAIDRPLIVITIALLAVAIVSLLRHPASHDRGARHGGDQ